MPSEYAEDIATIKANTGNIIKSLDALTITVKENGDKSEALGNRVTVLETNQKQLKATARSDKFIDRIAIIASTVAGVFFGPRQ